MQRYYEIPPCPIHCLQKALSPSLAILSWNVTLLNVQPKCAVHHLDCGSVLWIWFWMRQHPSSKRPVQQQRLPLHKYNIRLKIRDIPSIAGFKFSYRTVRRRRRLKRLVVSLSKEFPYIFLLSRAIENENEKQHYSPSPKSSQVRLSMQTHPLSNSYSTTAVV